MVRRLFGIGAVVAVIVTILEWRDRSERSTRTRIGIGDSDIQQDRPAKVTRPPDRLVAKLCDELTWEVSSTHPVTHELGFREFTYRLGPVAFPWNPLDRDVSAAIPGSSSAPVEMKARVATRLIGRFTYAIYIDGVKVYNTPEIKIKG
jgi:hypothetical protein